jgi:hypothetical protein
MDQRIKPELISVFKEKCSHSPLEDCKLYRSHGPFYTAVFGRLLNVGSRGKSRLKAGLEHYLLTNAEQRVKGEVDRQARDLSAEDRAVIYGMLVAEYIQEFSDQAYARLRQLVPAFSDGGLGMVQRNLLCGICLRWEVLGQAPD